MYIYIYDRRMHQLYNAPYGTNHYGASHPWMLEDEDKFAYTVKL